MELHLSFPLRGARIASRFGRRIHPISGRPHQHVGVDLAAEEGTPVMAAMAGLVREAKFTDDFGFLVLLDHGQGVRTAYAHLQKLAVRKGQWVDLAELLGYVGSSGAATGPHLHWEVWVDGKPVDPMKCVGAQ